MKDTKLSFKEFLMAAEPVGSLASVVNNSNWCKDPEDCPRSKYQAYMKKKMKKK